MELPRLTSTARQVYIYQTVEQNPAVALLPWSWPDQQKAFEGALRSFHNTVTHILPMHCRGDVQSGHAFGCKRPFKGFVARPEFPCQELVVQLLIDGFQLGTVLHLDISALKQAATSQFFVKMDPLELKEKPGARHAAAHRAKDKLRKDKRKLR